MLIKVEIKQLVHNNDPRMILENQNFHFQIYFFMDIRAEMFQKITGFSQRPLANRVFVSLFHRRNMQGLGNFKKKIAAKYIANVNTLKTIIANA